MVLQTTLKSPLDSKGVKLVNPKGNQPWIFIGRTDAGAPILWPPDAKSLLTGKDPDAGKDCGQEEKGVTEGQMVGWHHQLYGHDFEQSPGSSEGQGSLACCSPGGRKGLDTPECLNNYNNYNNNKNNFGSVHANLMQFNSKHLLSISDFLQTILDLHRRGHRTFFQGVRLQQGWQGKQIV